MTWKPSTKRTREIIELVRVTPPPAILVVPNA